MNDDVRLSREFLECWRGELREAALHGSVGAARMAELLQADLARAEPEPFHSASPDWRCPRCGQADWVAADGETKRCSRCMVSWFAWEHGEDKPDPVAIPNAEPEAAPAARPSFTEAVDESCETNESARALIDNLGEMSERAEQAEAREAGLKQRVAELECERAGCFRLRSGSPDAWRTILEGIARPERGLLDYERATIRELSDTIAAGPVRVEGMVDLRGIGKWLEPMADCCRTWGERLGTDPMAEGWIVGDARLEAAAQGETNEQVP